MKFPSRRAVTLIELLIVIAIIAILLGLLLTGVQRIRVSAIQTQCRNNLRSLGLACHTYHSVHEKFPRSTQRPRGATEIDTEPPGNLSNWHKGTYESWLRAIAEHVEAPHAKVQDAVKTFGCPADPRGVNYTVPKYGFTWYHGVYSNPAHFNDGILVDDFKSKTPFYVRIVDVQDGVSNTILIAERPPPGDGQWSWWDSACCYEDVIAPARGDRKIYSSSKSGKCPDPAHYRTGDYHDNCLYNVVWSLHAEGGNFCMGDGSVRSISFEAGNSPIGTTTLLEALSTRRGAEILPQDE